MSATEQFRNGTQTQAAGMAKEVLVEMDVVWLGEVTLAKATLGSGFSSSCLL